ncbi:MAG: hypothetical protein JXQ76_05070 [Campylobacterales bacterium]|nr:hypothetical protein [Campylobacterales bacterium]
MKYIVLLVLVLNLLEASQWHTLKPLSHYSSSDYQLKKGVEILELREYKINTKEEIMPTPYRKVVSIEKKPLKSFDATTIKYFESIKPIIHSRNDFGMLSYVFVGHGCRYLYNAMMIDSEQKIYKMDTKADLIGFLGSIDTDAEVQLVTFLQKKLEGIKYRKVAQGFEVIVVAAFKAGAPNTKCKESTYSIIIDTQGNIIQDTLINEKELELDCIYGGEYICYKG